MWHRVCRAWPVAALQHRPHDLDEPIAEDHESGALVQHVRVDHSPPAGAQDKGR